MNFSFYVNFNVFKKFEIFFCVFCSLNDHLNLSALQCSITEICRLKWLNEHSIHLLFQTQRKKHFKHKSQSLIKLTSQYEEENAKIQFQIFTKSKVHFCLVDSLHFSIGSKISSSSSVGWWWRREANNRVKLSLCYLSQMQ